MEVDWNAYEIAVGNLVRQGLTTSDAQAVVDAEMLQNPTLNMLITGNNGFPKKPKPKVQLKCTPLTDAGPDTCQHKNCHNNASWKVETITNVPNVREITWLCNSHKQSVEKDSKNE